MDRRDCGSRHTWRRQRQAGGRLWLCTLAGSARSSRLGVGSWHRSALPAECCASGEDRPGSRIASSAVLILTPKAGCCSAPGPVRRSAPLSPFAADTSGHAGDLQQVRAGMGRAGAAMADLGRLQGLRCILPVPSANQATVWAQLGSRAARLTASHLTRCCHLACAAAGLSSARPCVPVSSGAMSSPTNAPVCPCWPSLPPAARPRAAPSASCPPRRHS